MARRAHNSTFPEDLRFQGISYAGPTELFALIQPRPIIELNTFLSRLRRLKWNETLADEGIHEALYLSPDDYRQKYGIRKTWVSVSGRRIDLESFYQSEQ